MPVHLRRIVVLGTVAFAAAIAATLLFRAAVPPALLTVRQALADPLRYNGHVVTVVGRADNRQEPGRLLGEGFDAPSLHFAPVPSTLGTDVPTVLVTGQYDAEAGVIHAQDVRVVTRASEIGAAAATMEQERRTFTSDAYMEALRRRTGR